MTQELDSHKRRDEDGDLLGDLVGVGKGIEGLTGGSQGGGSSNDEDDSGLGFKAGFESRDSAETRDEDCLLYTSPSPRDGLLSRMPSSA